MPIFSLCPLLLGEAAGFEPPQSWLDQMAQLSLGDDWLVALANQCALWIPLVVVLLARFGKVLLFLMGISQMAGRPRPSLLFSGDWPATSMNVALVLVAWIRSLALRRWPSPETCTRFLNAPLHRLTLIFSRSPRPTLSPKDALQLLPPLQADYLQNPEAHLIRPPEEVQPGVMPMQAFSHLGMRRFVKIALPDWISTVDWLRKDCWGSEKGLGHGWVHFLFESSRKGIYKTHHWCQNVQCFSSQTTEN